MSVLSEAGVARREAGLQGLKAVVRRRGQRRVAVRALGVALVMAVGTVIWRTGGAPPAHQGRGGEIALAPEQGAPGAAELRVTTVALAGVGLIGTDASLLSELAPAPARVQRLNDSELQVALREAGEPAGVVRIGRRVMVEGEFERGGM